MREIKFRAKSKISAEEIDRLKELEDLNIEHDDGWVYGTYLDRHIVNGVIESTGEYIALNNWCPVDVETVGQYTGLKDKNGKDIYEGDIVEVVDYQYINECPEIAKFIGVIEYNNGSFCVRMDETYSNYRLMDLEMKVIANIYENPELMRKER